MRFFHFLIISCLISYISFGQTKEELDYIDFLETFLNSETETTLSNKRVVFDESYADQILFSVEDGYILDFSINSFFLDELKRRGLEPEIDSLGRLIVLQHVSLSSIDFRGPSLTHLHFTKGLQLIDHCTGTHHRYLYNNHWWGISFFNSKTNHLNLNIPGSNRPEDPLTFSVSNSSVDSIFSKGPFTDFLIFNSFVGKVDCQFYSINSFNVEQSKVGSFNIKFNSGDDFYFTNNTVDPNLFPWLMDAEFRFIALTDFLQYFNVNGNQFNLNNSILDLYLNSTFCQMMDNEINGNISLVRSSVGERFEFINNALNGRLSLNKFIFSETYNDVTWPDISKKITSINFEEDSMIFKSFWDDRDISDSVHLDYLMRDYNNLYNTYKQNGNLRYANACYSEMKDLETKRLGYVYEKKGGLANWFRWRLSRLMKFYTNHGTDPAKALLISFYIVLAFAVFYFFFPSEWDITSKSEIMGNIRSAINKNKKGTIKSLWKALLLLGLSLLNALTLSLNSFVTLGFGQIPTSGLARYICILQGFIGWFLLSIFSVALINQVLF